jgi:catechol 2,3-dioxygenase
MNDARVKVEGIDHVALWVRGVGASVAWYRDLLGLERRHEASWGDLPAIVGGGTTSIARFPVRSESPKAPPTSDTLTMWHLASRACRAQFEATHYVLARRGLAHDTADHGIAHSVYFDDPDRHRLEITTCEV